jgi:hypothetical protein
MLSLSRVKNDLFAAYGEIKFTATPLILTRLTPFRRRCRSGCDCYCDCLQLFAHRFRKTCPQFLSLLLLACLAHFIDWIEVTNVVTEQTVRSEMKARVFAVQENFSARHTK